MNGSTATMPTGEQIARCAYVIWVNEGQPTGRAAGHWRQAEAQLQGTYLHEQALAVKPVRARVPRRPITAGAPVRQLQETVA